MFFKDINELKIYLRPGVTDMRKSINTLSILASEFMKKNPLDGSLFLFSNKKRDTIKILYYDQNGFCLWQKRLEKYKFPWDHVSLSLSRELSLEELKWLLSGIDFFKKHESVIFSKVS